MSGKKILPPPLTVEIDWTDRCNVSCIFCSQAPMLKGDELDTGTLERLFGEMDRMGVRSLQVSGGGEPLFHREINRILEIIPQYSFRISTLTTNGLLLSEVIAEHLVKVTRDQITVSLNAYGEREFEELMRVPGKNFNRTVDNIRNLCRLKREQGSQGPLIALQFLIHGGNFREMPRMLEFASEMGVDSLAFNPIHIHSHLSEGILSEKETFMNTLKEVYQSDRDRIIVDALTVFPEINREIEDFRQTRLKGHYPVTDASHFHHNYLTALCPLPWFLMHVKATGDVYPCCTMLVPDFNPLGNIHRDPLDEIWRSEPYRNFRNGMVSIIRAYQENDREYLINTCPMPSQCKIPTLCIMKALPYLGDRDFYIEMDSLSRHSPCDSIQFPETLTPGTSARIQGSLPFRVLFKPGFKPEIRVNRVHTGFAERRGRKFFFEFMPDPLDPGFHLVEVLDSRGQILSSRKIEMIREPK